jgi:hypothetical protein
MKFDLNYHRALMGNDIDVEIEAEAGEAIYGVNCTLDGQSIGAEDFSETPVVSYHQTFNHVGDAGHGIAHKLIVEVLGKPGEASKYASRLWTDLA